MNISDELMRRFFQGSCNPAETEEILKCLETDPSMAEKYLGKKEWDEITILEYPFENDRTHRMLEKIRYSTYRQASSFGKIAKLAIAASLFLILAAGLLVFRTKPNDLNQTVMTKKNHNIWRTVTNGPGNIKDLILADGSIIQLDANSSISYPLPFPEDQREIRLKGKAFFKVAKDKKRPFTVFSGNISTTALGTQFTVDAPTDNKTITVRLHEGKVLINRLNYSRDEEHQSYYLDPNQELIYSISTGKISIDSFEGMYAHRNEPVTPRTVVARKNGIAISFNREPVANVFLQLEKAYQVNLTYTPEGLRDYYFTGSFTRTDSLERILRIIGEANKLDISKTRSGYKINKKR